MKRRGWAWFWALFVAALSSLLTSGCGSGKVTSSSAADAQSAYDQGVQAFESGNYGEALAQLTAALETPGLPPDLIVDALLKRAQCRAGQQDYDSAMNDIDRAEEGGGALDQVHLARGRVLQKRGDVQGAQSEFQTARKINPQLRVP